MLNVIAHGVRLGVCWGEETFHYQMESSFLKVSENAYKVTLIFYSKRT